ncbi:hypothetical protein RCCGE510_30791 (plasmid) [Rhizobium sp. CCGE 510]|nr:hypothetical protein RCCGE510_30791 [Rhizobium sp. CCGE 510]
MHGLAQALRGRRQPAGERFHVRGRKRAHFHPVEKQGEMLASCLRALEIAIDLAVIDADLPCQKPQNARRQDLAIRKRSAGISQQGHDTGKAQPVRGLVLPHDQVEIRPVQRVMFGDLPFVLQDGCRL